MEDKMRGYLGQEARGSTVCGAINDRGYAESVKFRIQRGLSSESARSFNR